MKEYLNLGKRLFPICRSITGNGVRKTLIIIRDYLPKLKIFEVKSGTKVFDWKIPPEWNVKNAYVKDKYTHCRASCSTIILNLSLPLW